MNHITDEQVADLPIAAARSELLSEIFSEPCDDRVSELASARKRRTDNWVVIGASAAAVAMIAAVPVAWSLTRPNSDPSGVPVATAPPVAPSEAPTPTPIPTDAPKEATYVAAGRYLALQLPDWRVTHVYEDADYLELSYRLGGQSFDIVRYPADQYQGYYDDRAHEMDPQRIELLGRDADTFTYSADDHATMLTAANGVFFEVRGGGMSQAVYRDLLPALLQTDEAGFHAMVSLQNFTIKMSHPESHPTVSPSSESR